jgi:beta-glucosidase
MVLLKNEDSILPLRPGARVLVAGSHANSMENQTGGWTISWQGTGNSREDFPNAQTIYEAIREQVERAGGTAILGAEGATPQRTSSLGSGSELCLPCAEARPDVAIVVFGETPYAEFQGDRENVDYQGADRTDLALINSLREQGIPVVSVFLSGRPLYVTPEINASNAFVAAWLPGSEGGGVADVLFSDRRGNVQHDFSGKLSFSWPRAPDQTPLNVGDADYNPLFAYDYGMTYAAQRNLGALPEAAANAGQTTVVDRYFVSGAPTRGWALNLRGAGNQTAAVESPTATAPGGALALSRFDRAAQEDALRLAWSGAGAAGVTLVGGPIDVSRQANGELMLAMEVNVETPPTAPVAFGVRCTGPECTGAVDIADQLRAAEGWTRIAVRLTCFGAAGADLMAVTAPFMLETEGRMVLGISDVRLVEAVGAPACPPAVQ